MSKYIGDVSAYAYAVSKGYTGTEEEFAELMADYADVGQRAEDAAESALNSKTAAQTAAQTATTKAGEASTSATSASGSATAASASASAASGSATSAANSATAASGSATAAAGSATTASTKASEASASATDAATAKTGAEAAQTAAETAQGKAEDAQEAAETTAQSISASAAQIATNTADITQLKSEVSALPTDGVVATSKQLLSENGMDNTEPYLFRAVPVNADRAELDAVVGGSVAWNQLSNFSLIPSAGNGITYSSVDGKSVTFSGTANAVENRSGWFGISQANINTKIGHRFLIIPKIISGSFDNGTITYSLFGSALRNFNTPIFGVAGETQTKQRMVINVTSGTVANNFTVTFICVDLTQMFGSTIADYIYGLEQSTAGAGVAFFRKLFPKDYYAYDAGTLKSVEGVSSHETVGFNQWDEEWALGYFDTLGAWITNSNIVASKNPIPVLPNTTYYLYNGSNVNTFVTYWKEAAPSGTSAQSKFISRSPNGVTSFTTPSDCHYIHFNCGSGYGVTYKNDICINLSDPVKNGTYEPYIKHTYPLDSTLTLRGVPKLADGKLSYDGDRYLPDGTVTRKYGIVDLGTLTWAYVSASQQFRAGLAVAPKLNTSSETPNAICTKYIAHSHIGQSDGEFSVFYASVNGVNIMDSAYTDAATFKAAMSGVYLVYELATPTTETADSYQSLQVCDPNGTEEFVSTGIVPVGHETRYPENLRAKIEGLPWDFSSLIAPTEKTTKASRNYTVGSLLIMNNVLYKVTANIANGGTITPNTNVTATTLSEVISALQ